jgi:hypothetical protein
MNLYKFTELSEKAKRVAAEGYVEDAHAFGFDPTVTLEKAYEILSSPWERHRYDEEGILIGKVSYSCSGKVYFEYTGMY